MADEEKNKQQNQEQEHQQENKDNQSQKDKERKEQEDFVNPIDEDSVAENRSILPYATEVGGAIIDPEDTDRIKNRSMAAMVDQTNSQMKQIYDQMQTLANQAQQIKRRVDVSERIYNAKISFEPVINHTYYLYEKENGEEVLSMIHPDSWGKSSFPFAKYVASAKLLADHTWEVLD